MEVDPATHDAVIAALGKVCAVTHALWRSKGAGAADIPLIVHAALHSASYSAAQRQYSYVALWCYFQHVVHQVNGDR